MRVVSFLGVALALFVGSTGMLLPQLLRHRDVAHPIPVERGATTVYAVPVAGGPARVALRLRGQYGAPVGDSDGGLLLVRSTARGSSIWRFDHGAARRIGGLGTSSIPVWSPDRSRYLASGPGARAVIHRLDGTPVRAITRQRGLGGLTCTSWSGSYIACLRLTPPPRGWRLDLEVWRDGGTFVRAQRLPSPFGATTAIVDPRGKVLVVRPFVRSDVAGWPVPQWTRDGRTMVFVDRRGRLRANDRVLLPRALGEFGLSADGRTVYVTRWKAATAIPK